MRAVFIKKENDEKFSIGSTDVNGDNLNDLYSFLGVSLVEYIEASCKGVHVTAIIDEEGKLKNYESAFPVCGGLKHDGKLVDVLFGNMLVFATDENNHESGVRGLTPEEFSKVMQCSKLTDCGFVIEFEI